MNQQPIKHSLRNDCQIARFYSPADRQGELYHNFSQSCDWNKVRLLTDPGGKTANRRDLIGTIQMLKWTQMCKDLSDPGLTLSVKDLLSTQWFRL